jgi:hypothetical protein
VSALACGALIFAGLVQVAFSHGNGCRRELLQQLCSQVREVCEIALVQQCFLQCGKRQREEHCMRKVDHVSSGLFADNDYSSCAQGWRWVM